MSLLKDKIELTVAEAELNTEQALHQFPPLLRWVLILAALAIIPAYYISRTFAFNYWSQRYAAAKIEAKPSFTNAKTPTLSKITIIPLDADTYTTVIGIKNENVDLSLDVTPYQLNFYDKNKELVATFSDKFFLLPNQEKYLIASKINSAFPIVSASIELPPTLHWQKKISLPEVQLLTSVPNSYPQTNPPAYVIEGNVVNNSPYGLGQVRLYFVLYNVDGQIVGASQRDEFSLSPYERRAYKQLWPNFYPGPVDHVKVIADTNTLDKTNLTVPAINGSSSDLNHP